MAAGALTALGVGVGGVGGLEEREQRKSEKRRLARESARFGDLAKPLKDVIVPGLLPGGQFRDLLAQEGLTRSQQASIDALQKARQLGSRTSAQAQDITAQDLRRKVLESIGIQEQAGFEADRLLTELGLEEIGRSNIFDVKPAINPYAGLSSGLIAAGQELGSYSSGEEDEEEGTL